MKNFEYVGQRPLYMLGESIVKTLVGVTGGRTVRKGLSQ